MPPPNITGQLHLGHALNLTLQDTLLRYFHKQNTSIICYPGFDHAGIATQIKVNSIISHNQNISIKEISKDLFDSKVTD
jgi:valyl-tRNA synthetase